MSTRPEQDGEVFFLSIPFHPLCYSNVTPSRPSAKGAFRKTCGGSSAKEPCKHLPANGPFDQRLVTVRSQRHAHHRDLRQLLDAPDETARRRGQILPRLDPANGFAPDGQVLVKKTYAAQLYNEITTD